MKEEIDLLQMGMSLKTHFRALALIVLGSIALALLLAYLFMSPKYKSSTVISIPTRYFQQPVVEDLIPSSGDASENKSLRESLLKAALGREFMETLRKQFNLFPPKDSGEKEYEIAMQKFQLRFEVISLGLSSFQISYIGNTSDQTYDITVEVQKMLVDKLLALRHDKLMSLRDNVLGRVDTFGFNVGGITDPISASRPDVIQSELDQVDEILTTLRARYSENHPLVKSYENRKSILQQRIKESGAVALAPKKSKKEKINGISTSNVADVDRYSDLLKRLDRLNIVLEYEEKDPDSLVEVTTQPLKPLVPFSPNFTLVTLWGLIAGLMISMVYVASKQDTQRLLSPQAEWAAEQKIQYIGKIPDLRQQMARASFLVTEPDKSPTKS